MLKLAADLKTGYAWGHAWGGQSNSRPWGSKAEGYQGAPELKLEANGIALTGVVLTTVNRTGNNQRITVGTSLTPKQWQGAQLRLYRQSGGTGPGLFNHYTDPLGGYATVRYNSANELYVDWVVPAVDETGAAFTGTCKGYLTFADDKWKDYPNVRVLTPYQPEGAAIDVGRTVLPYPDPAGVKLGTPGYTLPAGITTFDDLAVFLPLTFLEGIDSYGFSNEADSAYGALGARQSVAFSSTIGVFTNTATPVIQAPTSALAGGYLYVEWLYDVLGVITPKRSWARILGNTRTSSVLRDVLVLDGAWQGDGTPQLWSNNVGTDTNATIAAGAPQITASAGTPFSALLAGDLVVVDSSVGQSLGIVASIGGGGATVTLDGAGWMGGTPTSGANTVNVFRNSTFSVVSSLEVWVPHYNNNPNAFLGPGYRYPNNDMQPYAFALASNTASVAAGTAVTGTSSTTSAGSPMLTQASASWEPNRFIGWYVTSNSIRGRITGNTKTELYGAWEGGVAPAPGLAFTLTNELGTGPRIHNRPRGITPYAYGDRFGSLLQFSSRISASIGKDIHVVHLGVNSAPIFQQSASNTFGYPGQIGWWNWHEHLTWAPEKPAGQAERLARMLTVMAPAALVAEGSTDLFRLLSFTWLQGEGDALGGKARTNYGRSLNALVTWLRDQVTDAGLSPYTGDAKIPWIQPRITEIPYELTGTFNYYNQLAGFSITLTLSGDDEGWVNNHIEEFGIVDGFAAVLSQVDDLPKLGDTSLTNGIDPLHYDGVGEAGIGERLSELGGRLIEKALAYGGSAYLQHPSTRIVSICNMALAHIGEASITSLDDGTTPANLCKQLWAEARDTLLQARQWGFALRRVELSEVMKPPPTFMGGNVLYDQYGYCYAVPHEALNAFAVLPPTPDSDYHQLGNDVDGIDQAAPLLIGGGPAPIPFAIETSPMSGGRLLLTNQADATLRYVARIVDADQFPPLFATALSWYLASMLASSIIKGDEGERVSQRCLQKAGGYMRLAASSDGNQRGIKLQHVPDHLANR